MKKKKKQRNKWKSEINRCLILSKILNEWIILFVFQFTNLMQMKLFFLNIQSVSNLTQKIPTQTTQKKK